jgi:hypothetical protein
MKAGQSAAVLIHFAVEARFEAVLKPALPFRDAADTELERLKDRLLRNWLAERSNSEVHLHLRRAANQAVTSVELTPYPLLLFPALFTEMASAAVTKGRRRGQTASLAQVIKNQPEHSLQNI